MADEPTSLSKGDDSAPAPNSKSSKPAISQGMLACGGRMPWNASPSPTAQVLATLGWQQSLPLASPGPST